MQTPAKAAILSDRGVISLHGPDVRGFLQGLVTCNVETMEPGTARFGALLTPQGKILADFLVYAPPEDSQLLLLDCPRPLAGELARKLSFYRLRAKVDIADRSDDLAVAAIWPAPSDEKLDETFTDPRNGALGLRAIVPTASIETEIAALAASPVDATEYEAHRIALGVPRGGLDFAYGDAFPHEANMDRLHGVDFGKGCYVGQEVVSRMQHRGTVRTRIVPVALEGPRPDAGLAITAGDRSIGTMGSSVSGRGLALVRLDRAAEAQAAGAAFTAGGVRIELHLPNETAH